MRAARVRLQVLRAEQRVRGAPGPEDALLLPQGQGGRPGEEPPALQAVQVRAQGEVPGLVQKVLLNSPPIHPFNERRE